MANGKVSSNGVSVSATQKRRGSEAHVIGSGAAATGANNSHNSNNQNQSANRVDATSGNGNQETNNANATDAANNKLKSESFAADREAFLSAFEKPTQIYRYMRTRMTYSPCYLPRTLAYMKERMSRTNTSRKAFKVDSLLGTKLAKIEAEEKEKHQNSTIGKLSNQQNFYNIIFLGFSDPNHNWLPDTRARVEVKIARICMKKRKDLNIPIKKAFEGHCEVKVVTNTDTKSNGHQYHSPRIANKCPVISVPSDCINLVNGHIVRSYVLMIKVSLLQSFLLRQLPNGTERESSPNIRVSPPQVSKKSATVTVKRLSLNNNSTLNSQNNRNTNGSSCSNGSSRIPDESDRHHRMNPKVIVVKQEEKADDEDSLDGQPKLKRRRSVPPSRDREQFIFPGVAGGNSTLGCRDSSEDQIAFIGQLTIYDKQLSIPLVNADYELLMNQSQKKRPQLSFNKIMKNEVGWEILDSSNPKVQIFPGSGNLAQAKLNIAIRTSHTKLGPFTDPPVPWESNSGKSKGSVNPSTTDEEETETTKVIYSFMYNNNTRQQTEAREDLKCPWCSLNCFKLYSLLKHLKLCHTRFHFGYVPLPTGARIDVSINEQFDGSYTGSAYDLVAQPPGEAFARNGPTKRTKVFCLLVCRPPKLKPSLSEFQESEDKDSDQRRSYMTGHNRLYYHTTTCLPIHPKEIDVDSEGEPDPEWLQLKTQTMLDEFTDVNEGEKEVMKLWNLHVLKHNYVGDCQISLACEKFVEYQGKELIRRNLFRNFILHLAGLHDFGLLGTQDLFNTVIKLQSQIKDTNTTGISREFWKFHNTSTSSGLNNGLSFQFGGNFKFEPPNNN